jgi:gamma-glutamyl phosphate reductase
MVYADQKCENMPMNAISTTELMQALGLQAKTASALMARASSNDKSTALRHLAALLRENTAALQVDNAKDIEHAIAAGLAAPMVDRLKLTPQVLETCAQGCEQLAAMPDIIGDIVGMKQQPSGIRVGQMRVPIGVFGMIYESRPNVTIEAASLSIKAETPVFCAAAQRLLNPTEPWLLWCAKPWCIVVCPKTQCNWCPPPTARLWAS